MPHSLRLLVPVGACALIALVSACDGRRPADPQGDLLPPGALCRLGTVRFRAAHGIVALAYSPDGKILAVGDGEPGGHYRGIRFSDEPEGAILLWDARTGQELRRLSRHKGMVESLAFSADGRRLMSVGDDGPARVWDPATGKEVACFGEPGQQSVAALSPDGMMIAVGDEGGIRLFDVGSKDEIRRLAPSDKAVVQRLAFSPDSRLITANCWNKRSETAYLWDVATGREVLTLPDESIAPRPFSPDGKLLATTADGRRIRIRDVATGKETHTLAAGDERTFPTQFSADGKLFLALGFHEDFLWDVQTEKLLRRFRGDQGYLWDSAGALSPDGKSLAVSVGHAVVLFDVGTGKELRSPPAHRNEIEAVAFSPDGKTALTAGDGMRLWDAATGKELASLGSSLRVGAAVFTPDGRSVIVGHAKDETIRVWDVATAKEVRRFEGEAGAVEFLSLSADGKFLTSMSPSRRALAPGSTMRHVEFGLRVWDVAAGKEVRQIRVGHWMTRATASGDGRLIAAGGAQEIKFCDAASGRELANLGRLPGTCALALTPDGRRYLYSSGAKGARSITVWDVANGADMGRLGARGHLAISLAVSPDGRLVASGGSDGTVRLWDLAAGKELRMLTGHQGPVLCLAFSPDGRRLISGSRDTTALIWDVADVLPAEPAAPLEAAELKDLWTTLASPDGAAALKAVRRLARAPDQALAQARAQLGKPAADPDRLARLIADLDADDFAKREAAGAELARLGRLAEPALKRALEGKPSAELRSRATALLKKFEEQRVSPADLQALRALEVLELIGTPEAAKLIESLAKDSPSPHVAEEAKAAHQRLVKKRLGG
ncbi:MAG TPA: WD40 repeat domain-containing protein [Gemmataceae bacterium]|nr:WD40 repeat domain-containing protein [Gemmataceae bacterium]